MTKSAGNIKNFLYLLILSGILFAVSGLVLKVNESETAILIFAGMIAAGGLAVFLGAVFQLRESMRK